MAFRLTTTLGAAALALGCLSLAPAMAQETATPASPDSADKDTSAKMHPMHHAAMHPKMHGKMMHGKMHGMAPMAEGKSMQGVRSQDMGTDALNNQSLHAAQSNTAFTPTADSAKPMPMAGGMHGKMMHGKMGAGAMGAPGAMDQGTMGQGTMSQGTMSGGSMASPGMAAPGAMGGTDPSGTMMTPKP